MRTTTHSSHPLINDFRFDLNDFDASTAGQRDTHTLFERTTSPMPGGAFSVPSSTMTNGGALAREDDRPYGTPDFWNTFVDEQDVDAAMIDPSSTPASFAPTPASHSYRTPPTLSQPHPDKLRFLELDEFDAMNNYEEVVPTCLHYRIVWKVVVNNKKISEDTERDVVLHPFSYWHNFLLPKLETLLRKKVAQNRDVRCDDTSATVSVSARTEKDLVKRFDDLNIDWSVIANTLMEWGELFRSGKKLTVHLSFNYIDTKPPPAGSARRGTKRGSSATQAMLADRDAQLQAEEEDTGTAPLWKEVYPLFRCPGGPCDRGPYCWIDPVGKKHHHLRTELLKAIMNFKKQGNVLKSHDDVPQHVRDQLYLEERQRLEREPKTSNGSSPYPPINITNVLPQSQSPMTGCYAPTSQDDVRPRGNVCLDIPGPWDLAVKEYTEWQRSNVVDEKLKAEFSKACEVVLEDGMGLEQVYEDQRPGFFVQNGIKSGDCSSIYQWY